MAPNIKTTPDDCLADESIQIRIDGLQAYQSVTVCAKVNRNDVGNFQSSAHYTADCNGMIDITSQASHGGSYTGVEPMGLFWGMKPSPKNNKSQRFLIKDVENPVEVLLQIFEISNSGGNCMDSNEKKLLAQKSVTRRYKASGVLRVPVHWKRIRGTLFVPEGKGPFPALVDLFGNGGGLIEYRSAMFASRGFMSLALAYFDFDDLPKTCDDIDLEYFEEARDFLETLPTCRKNGISVFGSCLGGLLAMACASYIPRFKCAVCVNCPIFVFISRLRYKGRIWDAVSYDLNRLYEVDGAYVTRYCLDEWYDTETLGSSMIEVAKSEGSFLFVFGDDDVVYNIDESVKFANKHFDNGKGTYKILTYPGAGHNLDLPHTPILTETYLKKHRLVQKFGGIANMHALAQQQSWAQILNFLSRNCKEALSKL